MSVKVKFKIGEKKGITANYTVNNNNPIRTIFRINAASASFYSLTGSPYDNANLKDALDAKADKSELDADVEIINQTINENYNTLDSKIDDVQSDLSGDISALETAIQNEATIRAENDTLLQGDINTLRNDLTSEISNRATADTTLQGNIDSIQNTISGYGNIVTHNVSEFATSAQGLLADTALQPNDNISELVNNAGYITSADLPQVNDGTLTIKVNGSNVATFTANQSGNTTANIVVPDSATWGNITGTLSNQTDLQAALNAKYDASNPAGYITSADLPTLQDLTTQTQLDAINSGATSTNIGQIATNTQAISTETTNRQNADNALQSQIDALVVSSDVFDVVGTYAELQAYDISTVPVNDIIKVLVDSTHNNAATYYRCVENNNVKSWSYIGAEGAYYTKSESDSLFVPQTRTINNYALSNNITLTASDVGAVSPSDLATVATTGNYNDLTNKPTIPTVGNGTITFTQGGVTKGTITTNQSGNTTIALDAGGGTVDQTFDSTSANAQSGVAIYNALTDGSITPSFYSRIDISDGMNYGSIYWDDISGFNLGSFITVTGVSTDAINFPSSAVQVAGQNYDELQIINSNTSDSILLGTSSIAIDTTTSGNTFTYNGNEVATTNNIPTVNDATITFTQGGVTKGTITLNQSSNQTIALDAGGGTVDQTFDGTSTNAQSGVAIQNELDENYLIKGNNVFQSGASCEISESTLDYYNSYSDNLLRVEYDNVALSGYDYTGSVINHSHTLSVNGTEIRFANEDYYTNITIPSSGSLAIDGHNIITDNNLKTINNQSIIGSGNINISGGTTYTAGNGINITNDTISIDSSVVATQTDISDMATQTWVGNQGYITGITSSDVTTALGYTPYNSTNPDGYITSSALTNYVTTDTAQDISGRKTFLGEKAIYFKQQATSNKLGFTLYNPSGGELAALEYRPNTINGASLLALNCPQTTGGYVGFRYWGTPAVNIVAPKVATAGNYFMATHITNGNTTVAASSAGAVDISTLLPDISTKQDTLVSGTNIKTINNTSLLGSGNINVADTDLSNLSTTGQNIVDTVKDQSTNTRLKYWTGTQAQYDAIVTKDNDTIYNVEDTSSPIINILDTLYPVGAIYIGTMATCPLSVLGVGTWQLVAQDRVLQGAGTRGAVGTIINESLPNIIGNTNQTIHNANATATGAFYWNNTTTGYGAASNSQWALANLEFDASKVSSTYQNNAPVQQNGYLVNIWERIS